MKSLSSHRSRSRTRNFSSNRLWNNRRLFRLPSCVPADTLARVPELHGQPIEVFLRPGLTAHRGELLSGSTKGIAVLAGCMLYKRQITLEQALVRFRHELGRIFVHEIFHFVWLKLGNPLRHSFEELLDKEFERRARGELGWSAESLKRKITLEDRLERNKRWREYVCESFCDTAAWAFGSSGRYAERTLARRFRDARRRWLVESLRSRRLAI